ncbi:hypothetical protein L7F22_049375 [Adiantum nelumboides]|nr:hypothetical protein [Adiantum nelumboides]
MASSSSQRVTKMVGSGALSHVYIQYPPFRCNIPGSSKMMYDDGNRLLLVPSPNKVFSWPVARDSHPDSPSITTVDGGPVLAARFSLDGKILAIQNSDQEVSFFNRESGLKFKQRSRSHTQQILGFFWTDCPTCDIVFVTSGGLELYSLASRLDSLKLVDVKPSQVSWFLYTHESRLVLLASGVQCKTFLCYQFSAGGIIRLPKFEASLRKAEANQKAVLGPEDVHIATMYGRLYCLQVDRLAMELNIYRFYRDAVVPQGMLPVYSDSVAFSVVDGVLLVHQLTSKVVLLYDIFTDMKAPISAPLPLLLRRHSGFTAIGSANHEDSDKALNSDESNIYGDSWVFANPDIILDQAHGIMWRIHLDLEALAASSSDDPGCYPLSDIMGHGTLVARRTLYVAIDIDGTLVGFLSVYAHNAPRDRANFWSQLMEALPIVDTWIIGGDFNNIESDTDWCAQTRPVLSSISPHEQEEWDRFLLATHTADAWLIPSFGRRSGSLSYSWGFRGQVRLLERLDRFHVGAWAAARGGSTSIFTRFDSHIADKFCSGSVYLK